MLFLSRSVSHKLIWYFTLTFNNNQRFSAERRAVDSCKPPHLPEATKARNELRRFASGPPPSPGYWYSTVGRWLYFLHRWMRSAAPFTYCISQCLPWGSEPWWNLYWLYKCLMSKQQQQQLVARRWWNDDTRYVCVPVHSSDCMCSSHRTHRPWVTLSTQYSFFFLWVKSHFFLWCFVFCVYKTLNMNACLLRHNLSFIAHFVI